MTRPLAPVLLAITLTSLLSATEGFAEPMPADESAASIAPGGCVVLPEEAPVVGLRIGSPAPDFSVLSLAGDDITLKGDLLPTGEWLVLVTYRGGWCPFCNTQLHALIDIHEEVLSRNARLVAVSVDLPDKASTTQQEQSLPFLVVSDPSAQLFRDYNLVNVIPDETYLKYRDEYKFDIEEWSGQDHHIVTHPAVIIIDPAGIIRFFHVNEDYKVRLTNEEVLAAFQSVQQPPEKSPVM